MKILKLIAIVTVLIPMIYCNSEEQVASNKTTQEQKIGVLMVNHGSRSEVWRNALLELETNVKDAILQSGDIAATKTAFMEYTEPSIATRLKEFDNEGFTDVIIIPIFLTVSTHSFDDIPTIIGQKEDPTSLEALKIENIERYTPKVNVVIAPLLDFTEILEKNILRRVKELSKDPENEGLTLIAYGDQTYLTEWTNLLNQVGEYVKENTGIGTHSYGWCGHLAHYNPDSTSVAINRVLEKEQTSIVIPVLVAHDEMFQVKIIGDGIANIPDSENRVIYRPDAILQDENVENWVINVAKEYSQKLVSTPI